MAARKKKVEDLTESEALYRLLWNNYGAIDLTKIIYVSPLQDGSYDIKIGGKKPRGIELQNLQNEAKMIEATQLWKMMKEAKKNAAHTYMFTGMKSLEDSHYGKTMLYNLSIDDLIFQALSRAHVNPEPKDYAKTRFQTDNNL